MILSSFANQFFNIKTNYEFISSSIFIFMNKFTYCKCHIELRLRENGICLSSNNNNNNNKKYPSTTKRSICNIRCPLNICAHLPRISLTPIRVKAMNTVQLQVKLNEMKLKSSTAKITSAWPSSVFHGGKHIHLRG